MTSVTIATQRLSNQQLAQPKFQKPGDVVKWFGAVQAQDYLGSLWAVGLRTRSATERDVERAIADRSIVRTWPMRGTLHFVSARDVRWMLELLTPRIIGRSANRYRQLELDERTFARSKDVFVRALEGGRSLTRNEMYRALEAGRISSAGQRGIHILSHLAQNGLICFAARQGKQQTFALLDEWVPPAKKLARDEALAELATRYFTSHGPATLQDFIWWSGLKATDARAGVENAKPHLVQQAIDGQPFWLASSTAPSQEESKNGTLLLPTYDEYTVAYKDRSAVLKPSDAGRSGNGIFGPIIVINGQVAGTWRRTLRKDAVVITTSAFRKFKRTEVSALVIASSRYGVFLGSPVVLR
jgi:hypothetical protein